MFDTIDGEALLSGFPLTSEVENGDEPKSPDEPLNLRLPSCLNENSQEQLMEQFERLIKIRGNKRTKYQLLT